MVLEFENVSTKIFHGSFLTRKNVSHKLQQYNINFQRFGNRIGQSILREFKNLSFESK